MALPLSTNIVIISITFAVLAIVAVCFRFRARRLQKAKYGIDDYLIVIGSVFAVAMSVSNSIGAISGLLGRHMPLDEHGAPQIHDPRFILFTKIEFLSIIFSPLSLGPTKLSIVCFYRRIFHGSKFSILTSILLAVVAAWTIAFFFAGLLICVPVEAFWTQDPAARCFVPIPLFYTGAISDTIVDVIILSIPVPLVWKLNLPTKQKISVSLIFLLGAFIIGISAARIALFVHAGTSLQTATDVSYDTSPTLYWSQLECSVAVVCACLPTLRIILNGVSIKSLRNFASKFSLRSISTKAPSQPSIQQWDDGLTKPESLSAVLGSSGYTAAIQSEPSSHIPEGITVDKNVHQCSEARQLDTV